MVARHALGQSGVDSGHQSDYRWRRSQSISALESVYAFIFRKLSLKDGYCKTYHDAFNIR
jgi:hypothetical protein